MSLGVASTDKKETLPYGTPTQVVRWEYEYHGITWVLLFMDSIVFSEASRGGHVLLISFMYFFLED